MKDEIAQQVIGFMEKAGSQLGEGAKQVFEIYVRQSVIQGVGQLFLFVVFLLIAISLTTVTSGQGPPSSGERSELDTTKSKLAATESELDTTQKVFTEASYNNKDYAKGWTREGINRTLKDRIFL